jgi:hypothetical protein
MRIVHCSFGLTIAICIVDTPAIADCPIAEGVYRDAEGLGFELVFSEGLPERASSRAIATVNHPNQAGLYDFSVTQSNGYGSIFIERLNAENSEIQGSYPINFFDDQMRSANPLFLGEEMDAPTYAFITGLGSDDFYRRRGTVDDTNVPLLGDMIWVFDRCQ